MTTHIDTPATGTNDEPLDPDFVLLTSYLLHDLAPEELAEFERRFAEDDAFYEKVAPIVGLWHQGLDWKALVEAEMARAGDTRQPEAVFEPVVQETRVAPARRLWTRAVGLWSAVASVAIAATIAIVGFWPSAPLTPVQPVALAMAGLPAPALMHVVPTVVEMSLHLPSPDSVQVLLKGHMVGAVLGDTTRLELGDHSVITLRGEAYFWYRQPIPLFPFGAEATLVGEAVIEVSRQERLMFLESGLARVALSPGRYGVRVEADGTVLVTVASGAAGLAVRAGGVALFPTIDVRAGQFGRIPSGGAPERTAGQGYPVVPDSL